MKAYLQRPLDEEFRDSYGQRGLQPSTGGMMTYRNVKAERESEREKNRLKQVGSTVKTSGRAAQATGATLKATGTALRAGGAVTTRAGAALSSTGVGAIVGVPLVAVGATLTATGTATRVAGQVTAQSGKQAVRAGKGIKRVARAKEVFKKNGRAGQYRGLLNKVNEKTQDLKKAKAVVKASLNNLSWATWVWGAAQVPFALCALVAFALAGSWEDLSNGSGFIGTVISVAASILDTVVSFLTGLSFDDLTSVFILFNSITWLIGLGTIIGMAMVYMLSGVHCVFGKAAGLKISCIILALVFYALPLFNIFPWAIFWGLAVIKNPE